MNPIISPLVVLFAMFAAYCIGRWSGRRQMRVEACTCVWRAFYRAGEWAKLNSSTLRLAVTQIEDELHDRGDDEKRRQEWVELGERRTERKLGSYGAVEDEPPEGWHEMPSVSPLLARLDSRDGVVGVSPSYLLVRTETCIVPMQVVLWLVQAWAERYRMGPVVWRVMKDDPPPDGTVRFWAWDETDASNDVFDVHLPYPFLDKLTHWTEYTPFRPPPPSNPGGKPEP